MKKFTLVLLFVLVGLLLFPNLTVAVGNELITNGDFAKKSSLDLPVGWLFDAWDTSIDSKAQMATDDLDEHGSVAYIKSSALNDTKLYHSIKVEPNSYYIIQCDIRTNDVTAGAGANISVLDCTAATQGIMGSLGWTRVSFYGVTDSSQTEIDVAIRLGGYGALSKGEAWFDNVSATKLSEQPTGIILNMFLTEKIGNTTENSDMPYTWTMILVLCLFVVAYIFVYVKYIRTSTAIVQVDGLNNKSFFERSNFIFIVLGIAFLVRVIANYLFKSTGSEGLFGHSTDINCFAYWGEKMLKVGPGEFYAEGFADYPPGYMYVLGACASLRALLHVPVLSSTHCLILKLPTILGDLAFAYLVYKIAKRFKFSNGKATLMACLIAFNPVVIFISSVWGQIDMLLALGLAYAALLFIDGIRDNKHRINARIILAGAIYGMAILFKPQALMLGPVFAAAYIVYIVKAFCKDGLAAGFNALCSTIIAVIAAFAVIILPSLPFTGQQDKLWLIDKYAGTATSYDYASIEAFNLMSLIGGMWEPSATVVFGKVTYAQLGTALMILVCVISVVLYIFISKKNRFALFLCAAFILTGLFTCGQYMHERYLFPAVMLLLIAAIGYNDKRLYATFGWLSTSMLLNTMTAFVIIDNRDMRSGSYETLLMVGSVMTVIGFVFLFYTCVDILIRCCLDKNRVVCK